MPELDVWQAIGDELGAGGSCGLLVVARAGAEAPARPGMVMAVTGSGPLRGTVGGGAVEEDLVARTAATLRAGLRRAELLTLAWPTDPGDHTAVLAPDPEDPSIADPTDAFSSTDPADLADLASAAWIGPLGSGDVTVVAVPLGPSDLPGVRRVVEALVAGRPVEWCADPGGWRVVMEGLSPGVGLVGQGRHFSYAQRSGPTHSVHLIGAGHVAQALGPLLVGLDFRVVIVDERAQADLAGISAHERLRLAYDDLASVVPTGPASFAAVMGHSLARDAAALAALERLELGYLGLLGGPATVQRLVADRAMPAWFHGPMGLPIGSASPAEIAVGIAAEMVAVRSTSALPA